jgi:hypothetical protein
VPRLSIVIPCLGGAAEFEGTLVSVLQNRPADCEVLVLHAEPYDDPYALRGEVQFIHAAADTLVGLLNNALQRAAGEILHIIGCGVEMTEASIVSAVPHFDDPEVAAVSPVIQSADGANIVAAGVRWSLGGARRVVADRRLLLPGTARLRAAITGPTLAAAFYRRDVVAALDGFDASVGDGLADVEMALAIQQLGRLHICEPASRFLLSGNSLRTNGAGAFARGRTCERLFWRYAHCRGLVASLLCHPLAALWTTVTESAQLSSIAALAGRASATIEFGNSGRNERRLAAAAERLTELGRLRANVRTKGHQTQVHRRRAA